MSRKAYFIESKNETFESAICDKCGLRIKDIQDGISFFNPNPRALHRNICRNCFDVWQHERIEGWTKWREKHATLLENRETNDEG